MAVRDNLHWTKIQTFIDDFEEHKSEIKNCIHDRNKSIEEIETEIKNIVLKFIKNTKALNFDNNNILDEKLKYTKLINEGIIWNSENEDKKDVQRQKQLDSNLLKQTKKILHSINNHKTVEESVKSIIDDNSQALLESLKKTRIVKRDNYLDNLVICQHIKDATEELQNNIKHIVNKSHRDETVDDINNLILLKTNQFINSINKQNLKQIIDNIADNNLLEYNVLNDSKVDLKEQKQKDQENYRILKKYYEDCVKDSNKIDFLYENTKNNALNELDNDADDKIDKTNQIMNTYEISKINVQSFLNKWIIPKLQQNKIMKKFWLELNNKEENVLIDDIKFYFEKIENYIVKPYDEYLKKYHILTNKIDNDFEEQYKQLKVQQNNDAKLNEINEKYKENRKNAFDNFQKEINEKLPNIDFLLNPNNELKIHIEAMLLNKDITPEYKQKFLAISNKSNEINLKINLYQTENIAIQTKETPIYNAINETESIRKKTILENIFPNCTIEKDTAYDSNNDPIPDEISKALVYLEEELMLNNESVEINNFIDEWVENFNQIKSAKNDIKNLKTYKNITAKKQNYFPFTEEKFNFIVKERLQGLTIFNSPISNQRAQQWIVNKIRKQAFKDLLVIIRTEKFRFGKTIDKLETSKSKSRLWKFSNSLKAIFKWFKILLPRNAYNKIKQSIKPLIFLNHDIERIKKLKEQLDEKYRKICIKYAQKMAEPDCERSFFNFGKTDSQYLEKAKKEIDVVKAEFKLAVSKITSHYEQWVANQEITYGENGRANKKIKAVERFFANLEDTQTTSDIYEKLNDIPALNQAISERINETDYERKDLPKDVKSMINLSDIITDENKHKLTDANWRSQLS